MSEPTSTTTLRIPTELLRYLKHRAIDNRRSLNSEILVRIEESRKEEENHAVQKR